MDFIDQIKKHVRDDWDVVIAITGVEGSGKSTLMQLLGYNLVESFDQKDNIVYIPTSKNIMQQFNNIKQYSLLGIDEATEVFYKMDFMKNFQNTLVKMYKRERKQNKITALCIPQFSDLTKAMKNGRVKVWIHIVKRGLAVVCSPYPCPFGGDPWLIDEYEKSFRQFFKKKKAIEIQPDEILQFFRTKVLTYWFEFEFTPLPKEQEDRYQELVKTERDKYYKDLEKDEGVDRKTEAITQLLWELRIKHRYKNKELAALCGYTEQRVSQLMKKLNIK